MLPRRLSSNRQNRCFFFLFCLLFGASKSSAYSYIPFPVSTLHGSWILSLFLFPCREYQVDQWRTWISLRTEPVPLRRRRPPPPTTTADRRWSSSAPAARAPSPTQCAWSSPPILPAPFALSHSPSRLRKTLIIGTRWFLLLLWKA